MPEDPESMLTNGPGSEQPHIRAFVRQGRSRSPLLRLPMGTRLNAAARSSRIRGINIAEACTMQISDLAEWIRGLDEPSRRPAQTALQRTLDSFTEIGLGYLSLRPPSGTLSVARPSASR